MENGENLRSRLFNNGNSKQLKESLLEIAVCLRSGLGPVVLQPEWVPGSCKRVQPITNWSIKSFMVDF